MKEKKKIITAKQFATMGGNTTLKKYGKEHFRKIAQMRWAKSKS